MQPRAVCLALVLLTPVLTIGVAAQTPQTAPTGEGPAIGVAVTPAWVGRAEVWPIARLSTPLGTRLGVDLDAGRMVPASNALFSSEEIYGIAVRFMRPRASVPRSSRYWVVGPAWIVGRDRREDREPTGSRRAISAVRLGYGGDEFLGNSIRVAGEIGIIGGGPEAPTGLYGTFAVQWVPRGSRLP